jgi:hypothetical protein
MDPEDRSSSTAPGLRRVLGLSDLILYGITRGGAGSESKKNLILIMPIAPVPLFGWRSSRPVGTPLRPCFWRW